MAAETRVQPLKITQRTHQQTRTDDEHERQRDLRDHQRTSQVAPNAGDGQTAGACLKGRASAGSGCTQCRRQAAGYSGDKGNEQGEPEDREIRVNVKCYLVVPARHQGDE